MSWMYAEPMNIDGKHGTDLIAAGKGKNAALGWFEAPQDANDHTAWKWHEISKVGWIMSILKEDMDKDGDLDILISDRTGELRGCRWLENPGDGGLQKHVWKNHFVGAMDQEVMFICTADLNGDNNNEILVSERTNNTIIIYSNGDGKWNSQSIQLPAFTGKAKSVQVGDIDLDGTMDIVLSTNTLKAKKNGLIYLNGKYIDAPILQDYCQVKVPSEGP